MNGSEWAWLENPLMMLGTALFVWAFAWMFVKISQGDPEPRRETVAEKMQRIQREAAVWSVETTTTQPAPAPTTTGAQRARHAEKEDHEEAS